MICPTETTFPWACILGDLPGYRFHRDGTVWSCYVRGSKACRMSSTWHEIKPSRNCRRDYLQVTLKTPTGRKGFRVNVLILWAFTGHRPDGMEAAHKDGNRLNNEIGNLEWKTHAENIADKIKHGTGLKGEQIPSSKLKTADVLQIKALKSSGLSSSAVGREFGVSSKIILGIWKGKRWAHVSAAEMESPR